MNSMTTRLEVVGGIDLGGHRHYAPGAGEHRAARGGDARLDVRADAAAIGRMARRRHQAGSDKLTAAIGAEIIVDRSYRDERGRAVSLHTAMFKNPTEGVYHSPMNCYRSGGWEFKGEDRVEVSDFRGSIDSRRGDNVGKGRRTRVGCLLVSDRRSCAATTALS